MMLPILTKAITMIPSHALISFFTGTLIGVLYGYVFSKCKSTSTLSTILFSFLRYGLLVAFTLVLNKFFPVNLLLYITAFFGAFWLCVHKTIRMGL